MTERTDGMKPSREIRQEFLNFFKEHGHEIVPSSPVVPHDDPTLMFANAGMNQFKDVFLGTGSRSYLRAADTQKCIRAGGKHNDLDDVGQDTYHQTFFEMLGNWSFGDYFKAEAIRWAWVLLTDVWGIEKDRLHATYFEGDPGEGLEPDEEAAKLWRSVTDIRPENIHPGNKKDNFWEMGDTGPCGPCSEIHVDLTPDKTGRSLVNKDNPNVIELWNLVFIQFNRAGDGKLSPLPAKHVDTGMGFERLCAILNGKKSNYDTDVFAPLFAAIQKRCAAPNYQGTMPTSEPRPSASDSATGRQVLIDVSYRVIADHLRCLVLAITDGAIPSNEGRGYVLRRILRRAVRYGRQYFGMTEPFLCDLVETVVERMSDVFPELRSAHGGKNAARVAEILRDEEASFGKTLSRGIQLFDEAADNAKRHHHGRISGEDAFKLHDTYGFPIDLTEQMAEERGMSVDACEYDHLMEQAREKARASGREIRVVDPREIGKKGVTDFVGYEHREWSESGVDGLFKLVDGVPCEVGALGEGEEGILILNRTPFYAEQGGQVGDVGEIEGIQEPWKFRVHDTKKFLHTIAHFGKCDSGTVQVPNTSNFAYGSTIRPPPPTGLVIGGARATVGPSRDLTQRNHTATHLLNWALRDVLGEHVQQKGSLVDPEKTRFDFSNPKPLTHDELNRVQELVCDRIDKAWRVYTKEVDQQRAREIVTLRAVFGEKYPDVVRVVSIGADIDEMLADPKNSKWMAYSVEFCGGTHVDNSSDVKKFVLVSEEAVAKGVRRVVGVTGDEAQKAENAGEAISTLVKQLAADSPERIASQLASVTKRIEEATMPIVVRMDLRDEIAKLQKTAKQYAKGQASAAEGDVLATAAELLESAAVVNGTHVIVGEVPTASADALRHAVDWFRQKTESSAVLLACSDGHKVTLIAGMSRDVVKRGVKAGDLIREIAPAVGGKGGGRPDLAQGGGGDPAGIATALEQAAAWLTAKLA